MPDEILINATQGEIRIALLKGHELQEIYIERPDQKGLIGNIYQARVTRLLPGIQAAFLDIGLDRAAFLHINDLIEHESSPSLDIRKLLYVGQNLLVQVYKNPLGGKGPRLTTHLTIPGRYLVLTPGRFQMTVSQKIDDPVEYDRLLKLFTPSLLGGYIFRTASKNRGVIEIEKDKAYIDALWKDIRTRSEQLSPPALVYEDLSIAERVLRDFADNAIKRIRIDDEKLVNDLKHFTQKHCPSLSPLIEFYSEKRPIFDIDFVESELEQALLRKVPLKSGGYLIFDQTEAMTTVDVNTGSYQGHKNITETILTINLEAAKTIARQVRLRNLGGIIIIDFIDMENEQQKKKLLDTFSSYLSKDSAFTEIRELSSLGLLQMTRKRTRESLENSLCVNCPHCHRRGTVKSSVTIVHEIFRELMRISQFFSWEGFEIIASKNVIDCLSGKESIMLRELEKKLKKPIQLRVEFSYMQEKYDILPLAIGNEACKKN